MKTLPAALILEKNKISSPNPWIILADIQLPDATTLRICRNTENITFEGNVYTAFPFELDATRETSKGEIPTLTLKVSNVTQIFQSYLEAQNGGIGSVVTLRVVNAALLAENYSELTMTFDVLSAVCDTLWVSFELGAPNPLQNSFPPQRYLSDCRWKFKSVECGYGGAASTCARNLSACKNLNNTSRFGGFPGLFGGASVRLVYF